MTERPDERLRSLEKRLDRAKGAQVRHVRTDEHYSQANIAWRMVIELVSGLGVGFGIGLGLDALFGTRPWMLVLFTLLGFAAGVRVMLRTATEIGEKNKADGTAKRADRRDKGD